LAKQNHSPIFPGFFISLNNSIDCTLQTFKFCHKTKKVNQGLESQTPPYLPNGDSVGEFFYINGFKTVENGGVGPLQIPKKKPQSGQNAHQTQKPQISYILQT
jgi:hypothetical protein